MVCMNTIHVHRIRERTPLPHLQISFYCCYYHSQGIDEMRENVCVVVIVVRYLGASHPICSLPSLLRIRIVQFNWSLKKQGKAACRFQRVKVGERGRQWKLHHLKPDYALHVPHPQKCTHVVNSTGSSRQNPNVNDERMRFLRLIQSCDGMCLNIVYSYIVKV